METEGVETTFHDIHHHKDSRGGSHEDEEGNKAANDTSRAHEGYEDLIEEHFSQLRMGQ
jgi:hypothetical protein